MAIKFEKLISEFTVYGTKVLKIVERHEPKAKFSMRFLALSFGSNVPLTVAAWSIIAQHRGMARKKHSKQ